jgi:hypothetical protein
MPDYSDASQLSAFTSSEPRFPQERIACLLGRSKILAAFSPVFGEYSHVLPFRSSGYVDGLFHLSMLAGAAHLAGDDEVRWKARIWINTLLALGADTRNWTVTPDAVAHPSEVDAQDFAGPCALAWALDQDCELPPMPKAFGDVRRKARLLALLSPIVFWFPGLGQHVNSCMLAHLLLGSKPWAPERLFADNPFYSYIARRHMLMPWCMPIRKPWGSAWVWKQQNIWAISPEGEDESFEYTPVALYVADVLQQKLAAD